jgi:hypothetical protein
MVTSAGQDPWLTIEREGQRPIHLANLTKIPQQVWISGNQEVDKKPMVRALTMLGKLKMWHFPDSSPEVRKLFGIAGLLLRRLISSGGLIRLAHKNNLSWRHEEAVDSVVQLDIPTSTFLSAFRAVNNLKWALAHSNFDYLVKVTSTCLVNQEPLIEFIRSLPENRVYAGTLVKGHFLSGAALIFSRDTAETIVSLEGKVSHEDYDDVSLSELVRKFDVAEFIEFPRLDLSSAEQAMTTELSVLQESAIIRCRVETITTKAEPVLEVFGIIRKRLNWK